MQYSLHIRITRYSMELYMIFILLKSVLEYSYAFYLHSIAPSVWPLHFNPLKYIYGCLWVTVLFWGIAHNRKFVSTFFFQFLIVFQIIPITVIYALTDENTVYYSAVCFSVAVCEWMVFHIKTIHADIWIATIMQSRIIIWGFVALLFGFLLYVYFKNGLPTLMALNIYDVYKLRSSGVYQIGKYANYLQAVLIKVVVPVLLTKFLLERRYIFCMMLVGVECVIYLYTGHKTQLFMPILVIGTVLFATKENFEKRFWRLYCGGIALVSLTVTWGISLSDHLYSLFVRRVLFVSAQLSFYYYDFFSTHPLLWMAGFFPRWIVNFSNPYEGMAPYVVQIGRLYYGNDAWANNGFFSEGYSHFGLGGILLNLMLFSLILKLMDGFQLRTSFTFAVGCSVYIIFGLGDGHLLEIFGYMGVWILFLLLYQFKYPFIIKNTPIIDLKRFHPRLMFTRRL